MGYTKVSVNATNSIWVGFQCQKCQKINLTPQNFSSSSSKTRGGTLHANKTVNKMKDDAAEEAAEQVREQIDKVLRAVEEHRFSGSGLSCICAYCGEKQYWSGYGTTASDNYPVVATTAAEVKEKMQEKGWLLSADYAEVVKKKHNRAKNKNELIKLIVKILLLIIFSVHAVTNYLSGMYEWMITGFFALIFLCLTIAGIIKMVRDSY